MSNQPNKTNGAKPAVRKKKNLLDDRRVRLALSVPVSYTHLTLPTMV